MRKNFRNRVQEFWRTFQLKEVEIRQMIDSKADGAKLLDFVDSILQIAFTKIYFELGQNKDDKYELILTPEGDRARLLELHYWLQQAPEELSSLWNFYSSKPGKGSSGWSLSMFDIDIKAEDVVIYPTVDNKRNRVDLGIHAPKLAKLGENQRYTMFFIFIDQFIGELYTMEYIGYIDFVNDPLSKESVDIANLKAYIDYTANEHGWNKVDNPCEIYQGYRMQPSEEKDCALRQDIISGYTSCSPVLSAFYNNDKRIFDDFIEDGIHYGFLFMDNTHIPRESIVNFRAEVEDEIMNLLAANGIAYCIGGATGERFSYIDFIIFDFDAFLSVIKDVLPAHKFEKAGYSDFINDSTLITL